MPVPTIEWKNNRVRLIDQKALPHKLVFVDCLTAKDMFRVIQDLTIRGAPAIGIAGAFGMYLGVRASTSDTFKGFFNDVKKTESYLALSRPTARNLFWALERMKRTAWQNRRHPVPVIKKKLLAEAETVLAEDKAVCRSIGRFGAALIKKGDTILTHCNAGGLATGDFGTALALIFTAHAEGKRIKVFVDETRPVLQGARLTAWELMHEGIDATLICDNMAASLMAQGKIDKVIVGADRIASNGDVANKIGTYSLAVLAAFHHVPFYVAAPLSTFDFKITAGQGIVIEERSGDEVRTVMGYPVAPKKIKVYNPAFDVTPHYLVSAIVTEKGIVRKPSVKTLARLRSY
ncbi:MAG: S-methyl-5-thioribose-1-phosphate isomerase [Candidatus Omnitrophica bacterium]|nr:S-methyl-5-thioribose-1-phosphate isomerase [Candidatus Omnitrophota bacterium]